MSVCVLPIQGLKADRMATPFCSGAEKNLCCPFFGEVVIFSEFESQEQACKRQPRAAAASFSSRQSFFAALPLRASCSMQLSRDPQAATIEDIEGDPAFDLPQRED